MNGQVHGDEDGVREVDGVVHSPNCVPRLIFGWDSPPSGADSTKAFTVGQFSFLRLENIDF